MLSVVGWLAAMLVGAAFFVRRAAPPEAESPPIGWWLGLLLVLATLTRCWQIQTIPAGAFVDELLTLRNTLIVMEQPLDLFGVTPLINEGWVVTTNLYLTFNSFILRVFGVSYLAVKLFSIIPGILACGFFYLACSRLFATRIAAALGALFVFAHWHLRLSRYGWDASFLVMMLTAALWLILLARKDRPLPAYLAGVAMAIGLYSYINGRLCLLALGGYLVIMALRARGRDRIVQLLAFSVAVLTTAGPLLWYFATNAKTAWVRTAELSIFHREAPLALLTENLIGHALMFNVHGGTYARDNFPGLPMLDPLTGLLFLAGLLVLCRQWRSPRSLLLALLWLGTLAGGVFSISQEGAPYVYRASAAVVPTLLIAGLGLEALAQLPSTWSWYRNMPKGETWLLAGVLAVAIPVNLYQYFGLEPRNISASRVMSSRFRIMGEAIQRTTGPVYLVTPGVLDKLPNPETAADPFARFNGEVMYDRFGPGVMALALLAFSNEYRLDKSMKENFSQGRIGTVRVEALGTELPLPIAILLAERDARWVDLLRQRYGGARFHEEAVPGAMGEPLFRLITIQAGGVR